MRRPAKYPWRDWAEIQGAGGLPSVDTPERAEMLRAQRAAISYGHNNALHVRTRRLEVEVDGQRVWRLVAQYASPAVPEDEVEWAELFEPAWEPMAGSGAVCRSCGRRL